MTTEREALWRVLQDPESFGIKKTERTYSAIDNLFYEGKLWVGSKDTTQNEPWYKKFKEVFKGQKLSVKFDDFDLVISDKTSLLEIENSKDTLFNDYLEHLISYTKEEITKAFDDKSGYIYYNTVKGILKLDQESKDLLCSKYNEIISSFKTDIDAIERLLKLAADFNFPTEIPSIIAIRQYYYSVYYWKFITYKDKSSGLRPGIYNFEREIKNPFPYKWLVYYQKNIDPERYKLYFSNDKEIKVGQCYYNNDRLYRVVRVLSDGKVEAEVIPISEYTQVTELELIKNQVVEIGMDFQPFKFKTFEEIHDVVNTTLERLCDLYLDRDINQIAMPSKDYKPKHPKGQCLCMKESQRLIYIKTTNNFDWDQVSAKMIDIYRTKENIKVEISYIKCCRIVNYVEIDRKAYTQICHNIEKTLEPIILRFRSLRKDIEADQA